MHHSSFGPALLSLSVLCLCFAACKNQAPPAAESPVASASALPMAAAVASSPTAGDGAPTVSDAHSEYRETNFELSLAPKGAYATGQAGEAEIVLTAKAPFHVNQSYPYKFKLKESPGVKFANLVVGKDQVKLEPTRATLPVAFTPESAGKHTLTGQLSFSVCTDDKCMIEKRELALDIEAK